MTLEELRVKFEDSTTKVNKRLVLTKKAIEKENVSEEILNDFNNLITDTNGRIDGSKSLQPIREKYFPSDDKWCINEVMDNLYKLRDLKATNFNWKVKLDKAINEESEEKVEAIWNFLQIWREEARAWFVENASKYILLKKNYDNAREEFKTTEKYIKAEEEDKDCPYWNKKTRKVLIDWEKEYYEPIHSWSKEITNVYKSKEEWYSNINMELLDKKLDAEVKAKYKDLINRITSVVGTITDASQLKIGMNGDINGIIVGSEGKANIETIGAGGYNIQCFHFRTLIHKII